MFFSKSSRRYDPKVVTRPVHRHYVFNLAFFAKDNSSFCSLSRLQRIHVIEIDQFHCAKTAYVYHLVPRGTVIVVNVTQYAKKAKRGNVDYHVYKRL